MAVIFYSHAHDNARSDSKRRWSLLGESEEKDTTDAPSFSALVSALSIKRKAEKVGTYQIGHFWWAPEIKPSLVVHPKEVQEHKDASHWRGMASKDPTHRTAHEANCAPATAALFSGYHRSISRQSGLKNLERLRVRRPGHGIDRFSLSALLIVFHYSSVIVWNWQPAQIVPA